MSPVNTNPEFAHEWAMYKPGTERNVWFVCKLCGVVMRADGKQERCKAAPPAPVPPPTKFVEARA